MTKDKIIKGLVWACGAWMIVLGGYFILLRPPFLPEDLRFLGQLDARTAQSAPRLALWLRHVFMVMGGYMAGCGVLAIAIASRRDRLPRIGLALAGALTLTLMAAVNFAIASDFRWALAVPAVAWWAALGLDLTQGRRV